MTDAVLESTASLVHILLLTVIGCVAGVLGAFHRRSGNLKLAVIAYRIALWCLFFALLEVPRYEKARQSEEFSQKLQRDHEENSNHRALTP